MSAPIDLAIYRAGRTIAPIVFPPVQPAPIPTGTSVYLTESGPARPGFILDWRWNAFSGEASAALVQFSGYRQWVTPAALRVIASEARQSSPPEDRQ